MTRVQKIVSVKYIQNRKKISKINKILFLRFLRMVLAVSGESSFVDGSGTTFNCFPFNSYYYIWFSFHWFFFSLAYRCFKAFNSFFFCWIPACSSLIAFSRDSISSLICVARSLSDSTIVVRSAFQLELNSLNYFTVWNNTKGQFSITKTLGSSCRCYETTLFDIYWCCYDLLMFKRKHLHVNLH